MARTLKKGIDYFPLDVDFFENDKIQLIEAEFGEKSLIVMMRLLCKIYKEGYYYKWGEDECLLFARNAGAGFAPNFVNEVINGLVRRCFFDKRCYDLFGILTSQSIQRRYFEAVIRYKKVEIIEEFLLVELPKNINACIYSINDNINAINVDINPQKKGNKIKLNEREKADKILSHSNEQFFVKENNKAKIPLNECESYIISDFTYIQTIVKNNQLASIQEGEKWVARFFIQLQNEGVEEKSIQDSKSHFGRWLVKKLNETNYETDRRNNKNTERNYNTKFTTNESEKDYYSK